MTKPKLEGLTTEASNPRTRDLDRMPTLQILQVMNEEDALVIAAVQKVLPAIARAVDSIAERMRRGGRLIHCGSGTSGRLGVLEAAECIPTFSARDGQVVGLVAGGPAAYLRTVEGAEDDEAQGQRDLLMLDIDDTDSVVGITASGATPYVLGALQHARTVGAGTFAVVCNEGSPIAAAADVAIEVVVGPEVLAGSTRLKAGTATKLVLNMLTTAAFVRLGKVYGNLMVDVRASGTKLHVRAAHIVADAAGVEAPVAADALLRCRGEVKTAIVWLRRGGSPEAARAMLLACGGALRAALEAP